MSTRRVDSRISGPLISRPSCGAAAGADEQRGRRGEPERARAGDDQHGDRGGERERERPRPRRARSRAWRRRGRSRSGTKTPETRSASRCTGALPDCASVTSRAIWASAVSAPTFVARTTSRPPALTVAPATSSPGCFSTGTDSPVSSDWSTAERALLDDAVGRDLLARAHDEAVADGELLDGTRRSAPSASRIATSLAPSSSSAVQRGAGAALGARLEVAAGEDEHRHRRGDLEVDLVGAAPRGRGAGRSSSACRASPASPRNSAYSDQPQRGEHADARSACPSSRRRGCRFAHAARWNGQRAPDTTGAASCSDSHCQLSNCSGGIIAISSTGSVSSDARRAAGGAAARSRRPRSARGRLAAGGSAALVAGGLDRRDELAAGSTAAGSKSTVAFSVA